MLHFRNTPPTSQGMATTLNLSLSNKQMGLRIARQRRRLGLSLREAAEACEVDHTTLFRCERGMEPRRPTFLKILKGLNMELT